MIILLAVALAQPTETTHHVEVLRDGPLVHLRVERSFEGLDGELHAWPAGMGVPHDLTVQGASAWLAYHEGASSLVLRGRGRAAVQYTVTTQPESGNFVAYPPATLRLSGVELVAEEDHAGSSRYALPPTETAQTYQGQTETAQGVATVRAVHLPKQLRPSPESPGLVLVVDISASVLQETWPHYPALLEGVLDEVEAHTPVQIVSFAGEAQAVWSAPKDREAARAWFLQPPAPSNGSDLGAAIRTATEVAGPNDRIVVLSDGWVTGSVADGPIPVHAMWSVVDSDAPATPGERTLAARKGPSLRVARSFGYRHTPRQSFMQADHARLRWQEEETVRLEPGKWWFDVLSDSHRPGSMQVTVWGEPLATEPNVLTEEQARWLTLLLWRDRGLAHAEALAESLRTPSRSLLLAGSGKRSKLVAAPPEVVRAAAVASMDGAAVIGELVKPRNWHGYPPSPPAPHLTDELQTVVAPCLDEQRSMLCVVSSHQELVELSLEQASSEKAACLRRVLDGHVLSQRHPSPWAVHRFAMGHELQLLEVSVDLGERCVGR